MGLRLSIAPSRYYKYEMEERLTDINDKFGLDVKIKEETRFLQDRNDSCDWTIPMCIEMHISRELFKDPNTDYSTLKKWAVAMVEEFKMAPVKNPIRVSHSQFTGIAINLELVDKVKMRLLFDKNLWYKIGEDALSRLIDELRDHYRLYPDDELTKRTKRINTSTGITAVLNKFSKDWDFKSTYELWEKHITSHWSNTN